MLVTHLSYSALIFTSLLPEPEEEEGEEV